MGKADRKQRLCIGETVSALRYNGCTGISSADTSISGVSTLSARLKTEECIYTEYRMCDGSWHRMLFIVKKRDESGNVTHVL